MNRNKQPHQGRFWLTAAALVTLSASTSSAQIVAGWDTYFGAGADIPVDAPVVATGVTATLVTTGEGRAWVTIDERGASSDGTWGTFVGPPPADTTVGTNNDQNLELSNAATGGTITMTVTNNSGDDIALNAFHMDALAFRPKAARTYTLDVQPGGAITAGNVYTSSDQEIKSQGGLPPDNDQGNDIDHDLTGLADSILESGGTVQFLLTFSGGAGDNSGGHDLWIDNLAISASSAGADQLAITSAPASATAGEDFSITVQARDGSGAPLAGGVSQDTVVTLTTPAGNGVLSGNTATITMGTNSVTLPAVQYTFAEDITLIATQTSGDLLVSSVESATISINAGEASVLSVETAEDGSGMAVGNTSFRINDPANTLDVYAISATRLATSLLSKQEHPSPSKTSPVRWLPETSWTTGMAPPPFRHRTSAPESFGHPLATSLMEIPASSRSKNHNSAGRLKGSVPGATPTTGSITPPRSSTTPPIFSSWTSLPSPRKLS